MIVSFFRVRLEIPYEQLDDIRDNDERLNWAISEYADELEEEGVEIWRIEDNIVVTEDGYYIAIEATEELEELILQRGLNKQAN